MIQVDLHLVHQTKVELDLEQVVELVVPYHLLDHL